MRAMAVTDYQAPLEPIELPVPEVVPGYVLIRVLTCGVCFSDYKTSKGLMPYSASLPLPHVPGHEICGEVVEAGPETGWQLGDRVVVYHYWPCGRCAHCLRGEENLCLDLAGWTGFTHPGGFEEYLAVPADRLLRVPDGLAPEDVAPATCASGTAYRAVVTRGRVQAGEAVVILGSGGVGLQAIQFALLSGAQVLAVDVDHLKLEAAQQFGVAGVALGEEEARALVQDHTAGIGADLVINTVGSGEVFEQASHLARRGGRIVGVGYAPGEYVRIDTGLLVLGEIELIGTRYALRYEIERVLSLFAKGKIKAVVDDILPLEGANEAFERLKSGQVVGRTILRVSDDTWNEGAMAVLAELIDGYECRTTVLDSGHVVVGDEPESLGGQNKGPNPFALLQMSLANWTVVTLVGVSHEKKIRLAGLRVRVAHKQNIRVGGPHDPAQRSLKITELRRHIQVKGPLSEEEAQALLWGAEHCPVSNTLEGTVPIKTRLEIVA